MKPFETIVTKPILRGILDSPVLPHVKPVIRRLKLVDGKLVDDTEETPPIIVETRGEERS